MMLSVGSVEQLENCTLEMEMRKIVAVLVRYLSRLTIGKCVYALFLCLSHSFLKVSHSINMFTNKSNAHGINSQITKGSMQKICYKELVFEWSHITGFIPPGQKWTIKFFT